MKNPETGEGEFFCPNWENQPPPQKTVIKFQGKGVLTVGNILCFVSRPGTGKSSICEGIVAKYMNPECDGFGFDVALSIERPKILLFDTERSYEDTWNSWKRTYNRAGTKKPEINKNVFYFNIKYNSSAERKTFVETKLKEHPDTGLILFDGAGDFVNDLNNPQETSKLIDWLNSFNPLIAIITTIHSNTTDDDYKPRGWVGSELCRRAESVLVIRKVAANKNIREISSVFAHGKNRNDNDAMTSYYEWNDDKKMFISTENVSETAHQNKKEIECQQLLNVIFNECPNIKYSVACQKIQEHKKLENEKYSYDSAKKYFDRNLTKYLHKTDDSYSRKNI